MPGFGAVGEYAVGEDSLSSGGSATFAGPRSMLAFWMGGACAPPVGVRGMLGFWMGGIGSPAADDGMFTVSGRTVQDLFVPGSVSYPYHVTRRTN